MNSTRWDHITDIAVRDMLILEDMKYEDKDRAADRRYWNRQYDYELMADAAKEENADE